MGKEIIAIVNIVVAKHKFPQCKSPILINDVDINKIVGYEDGKKVRSLCIMLPKMSHIEEIFVKLNICLFSKIL